MAYIGIVCDESRFDVVPLIEKLTEEYSERGKHLVVSHYNSDDEGFDRDDENMYVSAEAETFEIEEVESREPSWAGPYVDVFCIRRKESLLRNPEKLTKLPVRADEVSGVILRNIRANRVSLG